MRDIQRDFFSVGSISILKHISDEVLAFMEENSAARLFTKRLSLQIPVHLAQERQGQLTSLAFPYAKQSMHHG